MGFSYMKSKLIIINGGNLSLNSRLCGQISLGKPMNVPRFSQCLHRPFNLVTQVGIFRRLFSVACWYGLQKINATLLLSAGRRFIHTNRALITLPNRALITVQNRALITVPYRGLAGQLAWRRAARWLRNRKYGFIYFCIAFTALFGSWQWIRYSNRIHLVISCDKIENFLGDLQLQGIINEEKRGILPPTRPESVRVQAILRDIVQAMHDSLGLQHDCHVSVYDPCNSTDHSMLKSIGSLFSDGKKAMGSHSQTQGALLVSGIGNQKRHLSTSRVGAKGEISSSEKIAQISPKKTRRLGLKYGTEHLERLNWEVIVVDSYSKNAYYLPNGKIVFFTGFLKNGRLSDAEIATVLAHEVGHGVGRHPSEMLMGILWYIALARVPFLMHNKLAEMIFSFFSRRRELEADYIGMLLMAAAGYDPRVAPKIYRKLGHDVKGDIFSSHPTGKKGKGSSVERK